MENSSMLLQVWYGVPYGHYYKEKACTSHLQCLSHNLQFCKRFNECPRSRRWNAKQRPQTRVGRLLNN